MIDRIAMISTKQVTGPSSFMLPYNFPKLKSLLECEAGVIKCSKGKVTWNKATSSLLYINILLIF